MIIASLATVRLESKVLSEANAPAYSQIRQNNVSWHKAEDDGAGPNVISFLRP